MNKDTRFGIVLGGLMAAVSVLGNVLAGDRHIVSPFPDLLCLVAAALLLFFGLEYNHRNSSRLPDRRTAGHVLLTTAGVFAALLATFATVWLRNWTPLLGALVLVGAFVVTLVVGGFLIWVRIPRAG